MRLSIIALVYLALSSCNETAREVKVSPDGNAEKSKGNAELVSEEANNRIPTEEHVQKFFKVDRSKKNVAIKFGKPFYVSSDKKGRVYEYRYLFANFYEPIPGNGGFCGMSIYFDEKDMVERWDPVYSGSGRD